LSPETQRTIWHERFCFAVSPAARQRLFGVRLSDPKAVSLFRQSIEEYLGDLALFDPQFHTLGIKLYEAGAVRGIQINPGNGEIEAEVISGKRSKPCQVIVVPVAGKRVFEVLCSG
jgi:hypothetical protein